MNYLAHARLSGEQPLWRLGGFLGDHVRGRDWQDYPEEVAAGILLHRRIDSFVDDHPLTRRARRLFGSDFRRYAGILLDLWFDHRLARRWDEWHEEPLTHYAGRQYRLLDRHWALLPPSLQRFAVHMRKHDLLSTYRSRQTVLRALTGVGGRLSRANPLHRAGPELERLARPLDAVFDALWPELETYAERERAGGPLGSPGSGERR